MSPTPPKQEVPKDKGLEVFDDFESYRRTLKETMARADEIIAMRERGLTPEETKQLKTELPHVVASLRQLLEVQLDRNADISKLDRADGSYDNADIDEKLRIQLKQLRNLNTDLSRMFTTKTVRKVSAWFHEDLPNWFSIKWEQTKDNLRQFLKTAAVVGGLTAGGVITGYAIANGGLIPGIGVLGEHLKLIGAYLGSATAPALASVSTSLTALWHRITGKGGTAVAAVAG
jgi:hypothetical protein